LFTALWPLHVFIPYENGTDWLKDALNVDEGWSVICFCHMPPVMAYNEIWNKHTVLCEFLSAYNRKTTYSYNWSGEGSAGGGYTNLFDASGDGFTQESDTKFITNWLPYSEYDNDGAGTIYHIKGLKDDAGYVNPYKFRLKANDGGLTSFIYATSATGQPPTTSDYDSSVKIFQHIKPYYHHMQFEIREALPENLIITANEPIVEVTGAWDALNINADFTNYKGTLVAVFAGHMHDDYTYLGSRFGYAVDVHTVACDASQLDHRGYNEVEDYPEFGGRQDGTVYEQCLDVVVVNRRAKKINTVRIGAGYDREMQY
ncbi:MAG: hypothetical protein J6S41_04390, partial [Clostridia bacterium]|nr:hypothetical protein [Clostridia bacterium]